MEDNFSREDTKIIKGMAVILMLMHHLWAFPDRIAEGGFVSHINLFGQSAIFYIGSFGKICVSIFMFLGGYGIYKSYENGKFSILSKLKHLYISYWKVFIIFIPVGFLFFAEQPAYCAKEAICKKFTHFSWRELIENFFAIKSTYNEEWWFLFTYMIAVLTFPFIVRIMEKRNTAINIFIVIVLGILTQNVFPALGKVEVLGNMSGNYMYKTFFCQTGPWFACFWMGILFAKDNLLIYIHNKLEEQKMINPFLDVLMMAAIVFLRNTGFGNTADIIYVPFLIICFLDILKNMKCLKKVFLSIGRQSTNMWLIHTFFCYYFYVFVKVVIFPKYAVLSLLILIALSYIVSVLINGFYHKGRKIWNRLLALRAETI